MVHDTPSRGRARGLRDEAIKLTREAQRLRQFPDVEAGVRIRKAKAAELQEEAKRLQLSARIEDVSVRQGPVTRIAKNGEKITYNRWVCSWREGAKTVTKYVGSISKMNEDEALRTARKMKAEALKMQAPHVQSIEYGSTT